MLTLTKDEFENIKCTVDNVFLDLKSRESKMNLVGSKKSVKESLELFVYTYLLDEIKAWDFQDDTYRSLISNKDLFRIHNRALQIQSQIKNRN